MDYTYTYASSDVSHTKAKAGDTERWASGLGPLLDVSRSTNMSHRELIKMDTTVLDIEMKKATVTRSELESNASFRNSLVAIATKPAGLLPENRRWHFKERAMTLCFYFWGYKSSATGAVTTRTGTAQGFEEDVNIHKVAFAGNTSASINSYGYSPFPLSSYLEWISSIYTSCTQIKKKPFIISITSASPTELSSLIDEIQLLRASLNDRVQHTNLIAIEMNTSCPNIPTHPPPAYSPDTLRPLLKAFADAFKVDPTLTLGLKLAPFVYRKQQDDILNLIAEFTEDGKNPIAFLTCTNTLGNCTMFVEQTGAGLNGHMNGMNGKDLDRSSTTALPTKFGGLAGEPLHYLSLGNVLAFSEMIALHPDPAIQQIKIIGVGGVTSSAAYRRMIIAGAEAVACATALGLEGVAVFKKILGGNE